MSKHQDSPLVETNKTDSIPSDPTMTPPEPTATVPVDNPTPEKPAELPTAPPINPAELYLAARVRTEARIKVAGNIRQGKGKIGADCIAAMRIGAWIVNHPDEPYLSGKVLKAEKLVAFGMEAVYSVIQHYSGANGRETHGAGVGIHSAVYQVSSVGFGSQDKSGHNKMAQYGVYFFRDSRISLKSGYLWSRPEFAYEELTEDQIANACKYLAGRHIPGAEKVEFMPGVTKAETEETKAE